MAPELLTLMSEYSQYTNKNNEEEDFDWRCELGVEET